MRALAVTLTIVSLLGCSSDGPEMAHVSGTVKYRGEPVTQGQVVFYPSGGRPASGIIEPDGTYRLTTFDSGDGALVGTHRVTITAYEVIGGSPPPTSFEEEVQEASSNTPLTASKVVWVVPQKYSKRQSTPLEEVVEASENRIDFDLE